MDSIPLRQLDEWENEWNNPALRHLYNSKWIWRLITDTPSNPYYGVCGYIWLDFFHAMEHKDAH